ncbi:hypothetical protein PIROE2DRAFT_60335, partial [Piromyces sp. E2]
MTIMEIIHFVWHPKNDNVIIANLLKEYADSRGITMKYDVKDLSQGIRVVFNELMTPEERNKKKERELRERIEQEIREKIEQEVREKIEQEVREKIEMELWERERDQNKNVTNWNCPEGWVFGYRKDHPEEKGLFPKIFIKICDKNTRVKLLQNIELNLKKKLKQFRSQSEMQMSSNTSVMFNINRNNLFNDAFINIMYRSTQELKKGIKIIYKGEEGMDVGGLLRLLDKPLEISDLEFVDPEIYKNIIWL